MTTVRVDRETKKDLLKISAKLQVKKGENVTFNETIKYLIKQYKKGEREEIEDLFGILAEEDVEDTRKLVRQLRKEGYERVTSLERSVSD